MEKQYNLSVSLSAALLFAALSQLEHEGERKEKVVNAWGGGGGIRLAGLQVKNVAFGISLSIVLVACFMLAFNC